MAYIVPTSIAYPPTGDQVGTTVTLPTRYGFIPIAAFLAPTLVPTTGQIWPRGNAP